LASYFTCGFFAETFAGITL